MVVHAKGLQGGGRGGAAAEGTPGFPHRGQIKGLCLQVGPGATCNCDFRAPLPGGCRDLKAWGFLGD